MKRRINFLAWTAVAALVTGCAPFNNGSTSSSGSGSGMCANSRVSLTGDSGTSYQQPVSSTQFVAQSFVLNSGQSISSVSLKLEGFSSSTPSSLSGTLSVLVVADASGGSTPSQPSCNPPSTCTSAGAAASGSLSLSEITLFQPEFYNIPLSPSGVKPSGSNPQAFWVVVTTGLGSSTTNYVAWDGTTASSASPQLVADMTQSNYYNSSWVAANQNMTFQVCQ